MQVTVELEVASVVYRLYGIRVVFFYVSMPIVLYMLLYVKYY